jgi:hypothetical protein
MQFRYHLAALLFFKLVLLVGKMTKPIVSMLERCSLHSRCSSLLLRPVRLHFGEVLFDLVTHPLDALVNRKLVVHRIAKAFVQ